MANHYRLLDEKIWPLPVLALPLADLDFAGGWKNLGMVNAGEVKERPLPEAALLADLHDETAVTLYVKAIPGELGALVKYQFPDRHGGWAEQIHREQRMILLASANDWSDYRTMPLALADSFIGWVRLAVRVTTSGVGTRNSDA